MVRRPLLLAAALAASFGALAPALPAGAQAPATGTVTGTATVLQASLPLSVCVTALDAGHDVVATTQSDGTTHHYELALPTGQYVLRFDGSCNGLNAMPELYDDARSFAAATPVTVAAGGTVTADAHLDAWGQLSGTVVDQFGAPVACQISTIDVTAPGSVLSTTGWTRWAGGAIRIQAATGRAMVQFDCPDGYADPAPRIVDVPRLPATAALGTVVAAVGLGTVSGTLTDETGGLLDGACVVAMSPGGAFYGLVLAPEGHWVFPGLPAGPMRFAFVECDRHAGYEQFVPEWSDDVIVDPAAPVTGVDAALVRYGSISVQLLDRTGLWVGGACMWVTDPTMTRLVAVKYIWPLWSYGFASLVPGDYKVLITDCGGGWASTWVGGTADPATAATIHAE